MKNLDIYKNTTNIKRTDLCESFSEVLNIIIFAYASSAIVGNINYSNKHRTATSL